MAAVALPARHGKNLRPGTVDEIRLGRLKRLRKVGHFGARQPLTIQPWIERPHIEALALEKLRRVGLGVVAESA